MNKEVKKLLIGYFKLTEDQKKELMEAIHEKQNLTLNEQRKYSGELQRSLGPTSSNTCPCCGR